MKKLIKYLIILIVLVAIILVGGTFYLIQNGQKILADNKPKIEQAVSKALKTPVSLGDFDLSVFPTAKIDLDHLLVGKTEQSNGVSISGITLDIKIFDLLDKTLTIKELIIRQPEITAVKDAEGFYLDGLPRKQAKPKAEKPKEKKAKEPGKVSQTIAQEFKFALEKFRVEDAVLNYHDKVTNAKHKFSVTETAAKLHFAEQVSTLSDFSVTGKLNNLPEFNVKSDKISFDAANKSLDLPNLTASILSAVFKVNSKLDLTSQTGSASLTSDGIDIASLKSLSPAIDKFQLAGVIKPQVNFTMQGQGKSKIEGKVNVSLNNQPIDLDLLIQQRPKVIKLEKVDLNMFQGQFNLNGLMDTGERKRFDMKFNGGGLDLSYAHKAVQPNSPAQLMGIIDELNLNTTGNLGPQLKESLKGSGNLLLTKGAIKGSNIASDVLNVVKDLPFLAGSLLDVVPEDLKGEVEGEDTAIRELKSDFIIEDQALIIKSLNMISTIFYLTGKGRVNFDKSLDLSGEIIFNQDFTEALIVKVKEIEKVTDRQGRLVIPLRITGQVGALKIDPDLGKLVELGATRAIEDKINEEAGKLLDKLF